MINFEVIVVFVVLLFLLISLYKEWVGPGFSFLIAVAVLGIFRIITPSEILSGFANEQVAVIILLLLIGDTFRRTSILDIVFDSIFKSARNYKVFMRRMMFIVAGFSAFLNNTPLVALLIPYVYNWSKRNNISQSKLLMPLSFAAILGGCATLIGTSTNLIVNSLVVKQEIIPGLESLEIFDFVYVGVPMIIIGYFYLAFIGDKLLPERPGAIDDFSTNTRKYIVELQVRRDSKLIGKTIKETRLGNIKELYLIEIIRNDQSLVSDTPDTVLREEDILLFAGDTKTIADMVKRNSSTVIPSIGMFSKKRHTEVIEVVVSHNSQLIGKTIKTENFRRKYDATVIAIHRNGEKISGKIASIELEAGDALLLLAGKQFTPMARRTTDFYLISKVKEINRLGVAKTTTLAGGTIAVILLSALGVISLFMGLMVLLIVLQLINVTNPKDLAKSIDYDLIIIIVLSLAIGTAMIKTGVAEMIATVVIKIFIPMGRVGVLTGIYLITSILAAYITNKAAVAIVFPISLIMSVKLDLDPMPFILVVPYAAAANFMTPIGYQTNLMIYGPGGYKFKDFFKVGFPLTLIYMVVTVVILSYIYFWS